MVERPRGERLERGSVRVRWDELAESPRKAEMLFDLVMHAAYPGRVRTVNGAGGDGGVDAWVADERRALEFKSFTRLGSSQRRQVIKSLGRAARREPASWTLVAPVHPTPGDLAWFERLRERVPFALQFHDVRWLESQLVQSPGIARYVLTTPEYEVVTALRELRAEQAALLGGVPDLVARLAAMGRRVEEASPIWGVDFAWLDGRAAVTVRPRPTAPPQHITVHCDPAADDPDGEQLTAAVTDAIGYGSGLVLEPGRITRVDNAALAALGLPWEQVGMRLPERRVGTGFPRPATLRPRDAEDRFGRPLRLSLTHATVGERGMVVHGRDTTGVLTVQLRLDQPPTADPGDGITVGLALRFALGELDPGDVVDPEVLLRTVEALDVLDHAPGMAITLADTDPIPLDPAHRVPTEEFSALAVAVRDVVLIGDELGVVLPMPAACAPRHRHTVAFLAGWLRGEQVPLPREVVACHQHSNPDEARAYLDYLTSDHGARLDLGLTGLAVTVAEVTIPVHPLHVGISRARLRDPDEIRAALANGDRIITIEIIPAPDAVVTGCRTPPTPHVASVEDGQPEDT
ncbi:hypothetical protein [Actinokineospora cianjurensis]|uniref:Uncharacterized protein n=1 Tax=Actinokineospora cianjurensis TaxID=585224 RepID=A0A421B1X6_9PSEU|nr:hypothetical protein [Actinokineospora cianjurensis]RLK58395.1 hypothetical protein CLV68_4495 [Actinokineospora cianjurensis]